MGERWKIPQVPGTSLQCLLTCLSSCLLVIVTAILA